MAKRMFMKSMRGVVAGIAGQQRMLVNLRDQLAEGMDLDWLADKLSGTAALLEEYGELAEECLNTMATEAEYQELKARKDAQPHLDDDEDDSDVDNDHGAAERAARMEEDEEQKVPRKTTSNRRLKDAAELLAGVDGYEELADQLYQTAEGRERDAEELYPAGVAEQAARERQEAEAVNMAENGTAYSGGPVKRPRMPLGVIVVEADSMAEAMRKVFGEE